MKKSEQAESSEGEDGVDMISKLPDEVLQLILSRLQGTEEAIRTSILTRRWRYLWTSVPSIDIDYARGLKSSQEFKRNEFKTNEFEEFVSWVLANKSLDLDSFRLCCGNYYSMSTIRQWIDAAVMRKVKLLDLMFHPWYGKTELPQCLVTCVSLEVLRLCLMGWPLSLPKLTGFPALRVLELKDVELYKDKYNVVKYFLESCPLLEDLSLIDCRAYSLVISSSNLKDLSLLHCRFDSLVISSPKVKNLRIYAPLYSCHSLEICCPKLEFLNLAGSGSVADKFLFESLDSLKKVMIHPECSFEVKLPFDFLVTISNVEYLSTSVWCIEKWFDLEADTHVSLPNLKTLELTVDDFGIRELIPFLTCLPDLESFHLIIPKYVYGLDKLNPEEAETINILTRHLKKVEFLKFDEEKSKLVVVRALLEHGNLLEEMVFNWGDEAKCHVRSKETMKEVSNFPKASSTVKLTAVFN